jgi:hypothetical protein
VVTGRRLPDLVPIIDGAILAGVVFDSGIERPGDEGGWRYNDDRVMMTLAVDLKPIKQWL